jgi:hypothetical protein
MQRAARQAPAAAVVVVVVVVVVSLLPVRVARARLEVGRLARPRARRGQQRFLPAPGRPPSSSEA